MVARPSYEHVPSEGTPSVVLSPTTESLRSRLFGLDGRSWMKSPVGFVLCGDASTHIGAVSEVTEYAEPPRRPPPRLYQRFTSRMLSQTRVVVLTDPLAGRQRGARRAGAYTRSLLSST